MSVAKKQTGVRFWKMLALALFVVVAIQFLDITITPRLSFFKKNLFKPNQTVLDKKVTEKIDVQSLAQAVLPSEGVVLPISWKNLGKRMIADGVIDETKFRSLFKGGMTSLEEQMLTNEVNQPIVMNQQNSRFILDLLWAFGLSNKNQILWEEMVDKKYGGDASVFASTGGWSLAVGPAMDHYGKHRYITLNKEQQGLVDRVSKNIYRPCCGNTAHFPDCNHGMAMLGLLELLAANNVAEKEMYQVALKVNSFWFPQTYIDLATYFKEQGTDWDQVDAKTVLGMSYSSAQGYQLTRSKINSLPKPAPGGGSCGT